MGLQQGVQGYNYASCLKARGWCIQKNCHCLEWNNTTLMRKGIYWLLNNYATFFFCEAVYGGGPQVLGGMPGLWLPVKLHESRRVSCLFVFFFPFLGLVKSDSVLATCLWL
jgi:hypothetical protein